MILRCSFITRNIPTTMIPRIKCINVIVGVAKTISPGRSTWPSNSRKRVKAFITRTKRLPGNSKKERETERERERERKKELTNGRQKRFLTSTRHHFGQDFINPIHKVVQVSSREVSEDGAGKCYCLVPYNLPCGCVTSCFMETRLH